MDQTRPTPDALLALAREEDAQVARGKLKIFFGFAPGVGKTFAMLQEARLRKAEGVDVVIGVIETHKRAETETLVQGLEILPRKEVLYRDVRLPEFDLDAALTRRPSILLVDELAHTNAPGTRHPKRWQDVEELLRAGINVFTTVNVQHLESLNDVVAQITGVTIHETIPDSLLEQADALELVDLPPEELLKRLQAGKVYIPDQAARAIDSFFRKGNLIALRELSLRRTADRVAAQMVNYKRERAIRQTWRASERLLVCVGPSPFSTRLVRATKRLAETLHADWTALSVETPASANLSQEERDRITQTLRLATQLGAQTASVTASKTSEVIIEYAREHNVTKIVAGKPRHRRLRELLLGSIVDELIWKCGDIDVFVITGEGDETNIPLLRTVGRSAVRADYAWAVLGVGVATAIAWMMSGFFAPANLIMVYLLAVVFISARFGRGPSIFATCLGVAVFDFCFVPPYLTFAVTDSEYLITFAVMLGVGILISDLTARVRFQAEAARQRERSTAALYEVGRALASVHERGEAVQVAAERIAGALAAKVDICLPDSDGKLSRSTSALSDAHEYGVAQWVMDHGQAAGKGTGTLPASKALHVPIQTRSRVHGVLRLETPDGTPAIGPERLRFIEALCDQIALSLERDQLSREARAAHVDAEAERMRNALLSSVSHDLRTPLTVIAGSASSLQEGRTTLDNETREQLINTIYEEAHRLDRLVNSLLQMSRLESGNLKLNEDWHVLEEIVGNALSRLETQLADRSVTIEIPEGLPLIKGDEILLEQVFINLLENAIKYTPGESPIEICARFNQVEVIVEVRDRGPGLPQGGENRVFEKFFQVNSTGASRGVGLGLAICHGLIKAHGGNIWAANREGGGAVFSFSIPVPQPPPTPVADS